MATKKKPINNTVIIYTAIIGNYDTLKNYRIINKNFRYVCFTDRDIKDPFFWEIIDTRKIKNEIFQKLNNTKKARYLKLLPHKLFPEYKYSLWIDANIDVLGQDLERRIHKSILKKNKFATIIHPGRKCIYEEAEACKKLNKDTNENINKIVEYLQKQNFPKNLGLFETNIIFREHNNKNVIKFNKDWWFMVKNFSKRDQLSFNYIKWKNNFPVNKLFPSSKLGPRFNSNYIFKKHLKNKIPFKKNKEEAKIDLILGYIIYKPFFTFFKLLDKFIYRLSHPVFFKRKYKQLLFHRKLNYIP